MTGTTQSQKKVKGKPKSQQTPPSNTGRSGSATDSNDKQRPQTTTSVHRSGSATDKDSTTNHDASPGRVNEVKKQNLRQRRTSKAAEDQKQRRYSDIRQPNSTDAETSVASSSSPPPSSPCTIIIVVVVVIVIVTASVRHRYRYRYRHRHLHRRS